MSAAVVDTIQTQAGPAAFRDSLASKDDASLVTAAKSGNGEAFGLLAERHRRMIFCSALRITANLEDAEDIVQQSLHNAFLHLDRFEGKSSFSTWLTRIALNEALMLKRRGRRIREVSMEDTTGPDEAVQKLQFVDSTPSPERRYSRQEQSQLLFRAFHELKPTMRTALQICDLEERSLKETARILGVSTNAAKSRVNRGRKALREKVQRYVATGGADSVDLRN